MGKLSDIIGQLSSGKLDIGQAADRIRKVRIAEPERPDQHGLPLLGSDDPGGIEVEDDGHEIADASHQGKISKEQYATLIHAVAEARQRGTRR